MKRKQILSIVLAASMSVTLFAGCGQKNEESKVQESSSQVASNQMQGSTEQAGEEDPYKDVRISDEVVTLTVAGPSGATAQDWNSTLQFQEYEKRLGIKLDATTYSNEQWSSKYTLMMAADEMPDILALGQQQIARSEMQQYADEGYLLDFSKYLDIMPNVSRLMEEYPGWAKSITFDNGAIYGFTSLDDNGVSACAEYCFLNQSWLDNLGLERPTTLEEFYNVLKAFKEQDANGNGDPDDEIPFAYAAGRRWGVVPIRYAFGIDDTREMFDDPLWTQKDGKVGLWNTTDNYKEYLKFMHKLYAEGLMNEDAFVVDAAELDTLGQENKIGYIANSYKVGATKELQDEMKWYQVVGLTQEGYQDEQVWVKRNTYDNKIRLMANADTKYPEIIAKFVDYLYTPEGSLSTRNGYPDVTFDWVEVDGYKIADHAAKAKEAGLDEAEYRNKVLAIGSINLCGYAEGTIYDMLNNIDVKELTDTNSACWEKAGVNALRAEGTRRSTTVLKDIYPILFYTDVETSERAIIVTDITNYFGNMVAQFVTGQLDIDAEWDNYLKKLDDMGLPRLLEIEQAAYDRYVGK